jgi:hypothetical protein
MTGTASSTFAAFTVESAVDLIMQVFQGHAEPTPADVDAQVMGLLNAAVFAHLRPHAVEIANQVLRRTRVVIGAATTLDDTHNHIPWLHEVDRSDWRFWPRLEDYLRRVERLPPSVLNELDQSSDRTLERLESPQRSGVWDRRGLVVGHVQSGKTTHYTALAAKALDAGYQMVIILAGMHNSLRSQTHERIDRHLIGRDSAALVEAVRRGTGAPVGTIGVGEEDRRLGRPELPLALLTCTTSAEDGDFKVNVANQVGFNLGPGSRLVLVVKKHATILRHLINWLGFQNSGRDGATGQRPISNPVLVIDDEADHASINTARDPEADPTTINRLIRSLLRRFERVGFVGYTATPFANIFVHHDAPEGNYGPDLFPRSFIVNLKAPSDYVGPSLVFGHPGDDGAGIPAQEPLPMYVPVADATSWIPDRHNRMWNPGSIPASLREAIRLFVLSCAARQARGHHRVHHSMLVHVTRFINVQAKVERQITDEVDALRNMTQLGSPQAVDRIEREMRVIWTHHIVDHHPVFADRLGERCSPLPDWESVWQYVPDVLRCIRALRINGQSTDALSYSRNTDGLCVIAIGGDKLSRGLTLEGLSVSYFLRTSNMFDTLMQMGRWFGYRPGYADLCRVFTAPELYNAFTEIALAMDDLRADLDYMAAVGKSPEDFGLRVRTPSDGLLITAANKLRRGEEVQVRFANTIVQALEVARRGDQAKRNRDAVLGLIRTLTESGQPENRVRAQITPHSIWRNVPYEEVLSFLGEYEAFATPSFFGRCEALRRYVREQNTRGELVTWTVIVVGKRAGATDPQLPTAAGKLPLVTRTDKSKDFSRFETQAVVGSVDEALDLDEAELTKAIATARQRSEGKQAAKPLREDYRRARPSQRGLLLLYLVAPSAAGDATDFIPSVAISFPESETAKPLTYTVNAVWLQQRGLIAEWDDAPAV